MLEGIENLGQKREITWSISAIRIRGDAWTFLDKLGGENTRYRLVIDATMNPATIDFYMDGQAKADNKPYLFGIVRRQGDVVQVLYYNKNAEMERARSFDQPPLNWWLLTLERQ